MEFVLDILDLATLFIQGVEGPLILLLISGHSGYNGTTKKEMSKF